MKVYIKPTIMVMGYKSSENFADQWNDIFGTGNDIPVSVFSMGDDTSTL